jgi:hypothetical protein
LGDEYDFPISFIKDKEVFVARSTFFKLRSVRLKSEENHGNI